MARVLALRPPVNLFEIKKENVLAQAEVGVFFGYVLPLWTAHEELFLSDLVPGRWDTVSDMVVYINVVLGDAEDVGDKFQLRLSWEHAPEEDVLPATSNDVDVETTVLAGRAAQYDQYVVQFTIDYNIDGGGNEIKTHELLGMRLRRIAASELEVDNDPIIIDWHLHWRTDKMFGAQHG